MNMTPELSGWPAEAERREGSSLWDPASVRPGAGGPRVPHGRMDAPRPFAWGSLGELDAAVEEALTHAVGTDGIQASTAAWMAGGYRALRRHVETPRAQRDFLSGDFDRQARVLEDWVREMRGRGLGFTAVNGQWRAARSLLRRVARRSRRVNPLDYCPAPPPGRSEPRWLSQPEAERVLLWVAHAPWPSALERTRNLLIVGLMLFAGLRRGEVVRLRHGDINLDQGVIHIVKGKGKNGGRDRPAYMPRQLRQLVRAYLVERGRVGWTEPSLFFSPGRKASLGPTGNTALPAHQPGVWGLGAPACAAPYLRHPLRPPGRAEPDHSGTRRARVAQHGGALLARCIAGGPGRGRTDRARRRVPGRRNGGLRRMA